MRMMDAEWENERREENQLREEIVRPSTSQLAQSTSIASDEPESFDHIVQGSPLHESDHRDDDASVCTDFDDIANCYDDMDDTLSNLSDDSESSVHDAEDRDKRIKEKLRFWALSSKTTHFALSSLLKILKAETNFNLPKDARTLLKTPSSTSTVIKDIGGGQFWYNGVSNCLKAYFTNLNPNHSTVWLDFSMDGLPIHNSGPTQLWPILMRVCDLPQAPIFVVAIFCGKSKPSSAEVFLRELVTELNELQSDGIDLSGSMFKVRINAILADTPARTFVKGIIGHSGHDSCLKCTERTRYDHLSRRIYFVGIEAPNRTDALFRDGTYRAHIRHSTSLIDLANFDMIMDIPTTDRLHLVDLGVMRHLMRSWRSGAFGEQYKWDRADVGFITSVMESVKLPSEVLRKLRGIQHLNFWKGTEFKNFLHYPSIVALKDTLPREAYYATLYGESMLQSIKHLIRTGNNIIPQLINRVREFDNMNITGSRADQDSHTYPIIAMKQNRSTLHVRKNFMLRQGQRDQWYLLKNNMIMKFKNAAESDGNVTVEGQYFLRQRSYFMRPCNSAFLNIYCVGLEDLSEETYTVGIDNIKCKLVTVSSADDESMVVLPLLHKLV
uniref:Transposase domain-containing protein n=1 Tax=Anopheles arabiensis TaxID=7173 RepID=A0A182IDV3_ANOAR